MFEIKKFVGIEIFKKSLHLLHLAQWNQMNQNLPINEKLKLTGFTCVISAVFSLQAINIFINK